MRGQRSVVLLMMLLAALGGCGGSGSSGFDPAGFEPPLIEQAIAEQRCVHGEGELLICPSGATVTEPVGGMPSPGSDLRVAASLERMGIDCDPRDAPACGLSVAVATEGLPAGAELRLALRVVPEGRWRIGAPLATAPASGGTDVLAPVGTELAGDAGPADEVQVAVLVFVAPVADVPAEVAELRATGARYAFVLAPMLVTSASP